MKKQLLIALAMFIAADTHATTRKVLFLGNSYVYTNDLPLMLQQMATSMGDTLIYDQNTPGGFTFEQHSTDPTTISKIFSQQWDIVILQEQSQRPAFSPAQVADDTYPYAKKLDSMIRKNRTCTETMFFMTWGRKNGDASNCAFYPPICTYEGMQTRLRESYMQMTQDNNAIVAPVGAAWKQMRDSFPSVDLYVPDESHPSVSGTYLAACVFYASIFHKNPMQTTFNSTLSANDANNIKRISKRVVLDSFSKWNMYGNYTYANFTKSVAGKTATFTNTSLYNTNNYWTFGNGNTSTIASPAHTYATNGKYQVTLTASNGCFSETRKDSVTIGGVNIEATAIQMPELAIGSEHGIVRFTNKSASAYISLIIYDINGRSIADVELPPATTAEKTLVPGIYIYQAKTKDGVINTNKFSVQ